MKQNLNQSKRLLNVGCGNRWHPDWVNVDLVSSSREVVQYDVSSGLPFPSNHFDAVYHSHVLEHLAPADGELLIAECFRVLKPGGVLRIVVPDLEQIARIYLQLLDQAASGDSLAAENYEWIKLELLDQMVRTTSGGLMGQYMSRPDLENRDFVQSRMGNEVAATANREQSSPSLGSRLKQFKKLLCLKLAKKILGRELSGALDEAIFRSQGEIHRWMYDRFSLQKLARKNGFAQSRICSAFESEIEDFQRFQLDAIGMKVRKPDSLFMEFYKPSAMAGQKAA